MELNELSDFITKDFQDINKLARNLIKVFIRGSYLGDDKHHLENLRNELRNDDEFKIPGAFLMEDIETEKEMKFHQKFELVWNNITKGDNYPLCIVYAGETASDSLGLNAEIQTIVTDSNKKQNTYLIRHIGIGLVQHADEIVNCHHVKSVDDFKKIAKDIVRAKLKEIETFLIYKQTKGGVKNVER